MTAKMLHLVRYKFPSLEPASLFLIPGSFLQERFRRDILHRAVIYEADNDRQGTASSKRRNEITCSGRKLYRQKGTGHARVGDASSPIRRGGAKSHGPKPRDFSTKLQTQVYNLAMRIALSARFINNELTILENPINLSQPKTRILLEVLKQHKLGHEYGKALFVLNDNYFEDESLKNNNLLLASRQLGYHCSFIPVGEFQVRDALKFGKLFIDSEAMSLIVEKFAQRNTLSDMDQPASLTAYVDANSSSFTNSKPEPSLSL